MTNVSASTPTEAPAQVRYFTPEEAADYLRSSPSTLAKRRLTGDGPMFCKLGRVVRYRQADLDAWMSTHVARSTSDSVKAA